MKTRIYANLMDGAKIVDTATKILDIPSEMLPHKGDSIDLGIGVRGEWPVVCQRDAHPLRVDGPHWTIHAKADASMIKRLQEAGWDS
jgi:hypothetical protein